MKKMDGLWEDIDKDVLTRLKLDLGMTPPKIKRDVAGIREWINLQPHLPNLPDDEENNQKLETLLFYAKNRVEKVKNTLDLYFKAKGSLTEIYKNRNPEDPLIRHDAKVTYLMHFPKLTPKGLRIHYFGHIVPEATAYNPTQCFRRVAMMLDLMFKDAPVAGNIFIMDLKYSSLAHWSRYNLALLSKCAFLIFNATVVRINAVHYINAPPFITQVLAVVNAFMSDKLRKRVHVHKTGNISQLFEDVPEDCIPKELGGSMDVTLEEINDYCYERLIKHKQWFLEDEKMVSDESKRPTALNNKDGIFGTEGTFRTLSLD